MTLHKALAAIALTSLCCVATSLVAQSYLTAIGNPTFGVNIPIEDGFINVSNGNVHLEIPLASFAERGRLPLNERIVYDSRLWQIVDNGGDYSFQPTNVPNSWSGWRVTAGNEVGSVSGPQVYSNYEQCPHDGRDDGATMSTTLEGFTWTDPQGTSHMFNAITQDARDYTPNACTENGYPPANDQPASAGWAIDGSGYSVEVTNYRQMVVYDPNGNEVYPTIQDTNGNYFSADANGNLIDTRGLRPVLKTTGGNNVYYDVLIPGGTTKRYTATLASINVGSSFGQSGVGDYSGQLQAISSIALPDGTSYSFSYDSYGELISMTWPTGGVISFGYSNFQDSYQNVNRWVTGYSGGRGSLSFAPQVVTQCSVSNGVPIGCQEQTTLTDGVGSQTVYTFVLNGGAWQTNETVYSGSANGGTAVMSTATSYNFSNSCSLLSCNGNAEWVTAGTTTTTLKDTNQVSQTVSTYAQPWLGKPTQIEYWDYYTGTTPSTPSRIANYTYGYMVGGGPAQLLTATNQTDGSGNVLQQTQNTYDCGSSCTLRASGAPSHNSVTANRGNLTSVTKGVASNGGTVTVSSTFDDAGVLLSATDALGTNTASYAHDSTDTFVITTTLPSTSGISHITQAGYDPYTGSILNMIDMNDQPTVYKYDTLGRLSSKKNADGGVITYSYPSATEQDVTSTVCHHL